MQIVDNATVIEPINLSEAKAYIQIDQDYATDDAAVILAMTAARKRIENYINIGLAEREVTVFWDGRPIELPLSPTGDILEVRDGSETPLDANKYTVKLYPAKQIGINSVCSYNGSWFYGINGYVEFTLNRETSNKVYSVKYKTGYTSLPLDLKQALLAETNYLFNLKGFPVANSISADAAILANSYSRNLIL